MAVYTTISLQQAKSIARGYPIDDVISLCEISSGIQNSNYILSTKTKKYIFTIYENYKIKKQKSDCDFYSNLNFYTEYMQAINNNVINCPTPIANTSGKFLFEFKQKLGAIVNFVDGKPVTVSKKIHLVQLGKTLAKIHLCSSKVNIKPPVIDRLDQLNNYYLSVSKKGYKIFDDNQNFVKEKLDCIIKNYPTNCPKGIIHSDLFKDNVFFQDNRLVSVIDLYDSHFSDLIYDIAVVICAWCYDKNNLVNKQLVKAFTDSYDSVRNINKLELDNLDYFVKLVALKFFLMRCKFNIYNKEATILNPKDPLEYLAKM